MGKHVFDVKGFSPSRVRTDQIWSEATALKGFQSAGHRHAALHFFAQLAQRDGVWVGGGRCSRELGAMQHDFNPRRSDGWLIDAQCDDFMPTGSEGRRQMFELTREVLVNEQDAHPPIVPICGRFRGRSGSFQTALAMMLRGRVANNNAPAHTEPQTTSPHR